MYYCTFARSIAHFEQFHIALLHSINIVNSAADGTSIEYGNSAQGHLHVYFDIF